MPSRKKASSPSRTFGWFLFGLFEADLRVQRARKHLAELKRVLKALRNPQADFISDDFDIYSSESVEELGELASGSVQVIIGDFVHNLRTALNYALAALRERFSPTTFTSKSKNNFPLESCPNEFTRKGKTLFKGIGNVHIAQIEAVQPYNRCEWTRLLQDLSNDDKHRQLVTVHHEIWSTTLEVETEESARDSAMEMHRYHEIKVTLADGTPIIEPLEELQAQVAAFLQQLNANLIAEWKAQPTRKKS